MYILASNLIFVLKIILLWIEKHIFNEQKENVCAKQHIYIDINIQYLCTSKNIYM